MKLIDDGGFGTHKPMAEPPLAFWITLLVIGVGLLALLFDIGPPAP